jgi:hypothetical protein
MPTQPSEGQRPIAELVIEDIRARAELGVRKYGAPLHAHNGRSALMDLYQELLDGAHYVRQEIEEREAARAMAPEGATAEVWRSLATSSHAEAVGTVLLPLLDALGWDEKRCAPEGPVEYARRMRSDAVQGATFLGAIAEIRGMVGPKDDEKTVDAVRRRLANNAVEIETLHAGLRAFANVRDEGAVETHRWRDRALCAEAKVVALKEEHAAVESWGNEGAREMKAEIDRLRALLSKAESDRAESDELFARIVVLVDRVSALRAAVRAARVRAQQAEAKLDGALRRAEGGADVAARLRAIIDPEGHWNIDGLLGRVRALQEQAARGESTEALLAAQRDLTEIEEAVRRDLGQHGGDGPVLNVIARASCALSLAQSNIQAAWDEIGPARAEDVYARRSGRGLAEAIRADREESTRQLSQDYTEKGDQLAQMIDRYEALKAEATAEVGSAEVAPAAPVETPQATETQPDPGEGWRLLGPEEVIETGDQWWGGAMVGPVWLAASATIGETPAAINAHPKATERRVFRRLITAPIAPAPAVEPVTEVAIEVRGSKFVIVRRAVAP